MNRVLQFRPGRKARLLALAGVGLAASSAHAAIDTTAAVAAITDAGTAVGVVGAAVFLVMIGIKVWHWLRRT